MVKLPLILQGPPSRLPDTFMASAAALPVMEPSRLSDDASLHTESQTVASILAEARVLPEDESSPFREFEEPDDTLDLDGDKDWDVLFEGEDEAGPTETSSLPEYVTRCTTKKIQREKFVELRRSLRQPSNCESLTVPQVNPCTLRELLKWQRLSDSRMQYLQGLMSRSLSAIVVAREALLSKNTEVAGKQLTTAIAVLGNGFLGMSHRRRDLLKSGINRRYQSLCGPTVPVTKFLFGDHIQEAVKEIDDASKLSRSMAPQQRYHPYHRPQAPSQKQRHVPNPKPGLNWKGSPAPWKGQSARFQSKKPYMAKPYQAADRRSSYHAPETRNP